MARWRHKERRQLTADQRALLTGGPMFMATEGESDDEVVVRVCGSFEVAAGLWELFQAEITMANPIPGERPWAFWQFAAPRWESKQTMPAGIHILQHVPARCRPIPYDQAKVLKRFKMLSPLEELQLREEA